jgi:predicted ATPase/class 3 adenylate cyclase
MIEGVPRDLPAGTVTFLITDVEGSTRLLQELGTVRYARALSGLRRMLRATFNEHGGTEVDTQGDSLFVAFPTAPSAARAAARAVKQLSSGPLRVRIGIHTGTPLVGDEGYVGVDVHRAARIAASGHGGQVLVSASTAALLDDEPLRDLGEHGLKDLTEPQRLYQLVIPGVEKSFPPLNTLDNRPTNLATQPTALIGREHELAETADLLRSDEVRLLTLTGAAGTGKTRLALHLAAELLEEFPEGVFVVDLTTIRDSSLLTPTIAQTLVVRELPGQSLEGTLAEYLHGRRLLLLLDNFEQIAAGAPTLGVLLAAAPGLKLLVTSRTALRLAAEREYAVEPLELPDPERLPDVAALSHYDAVALFVERARAVRPDFEVTKANSRAVAEICARLDGLPLAIELAAANIRALTPQALLRHLQPRLKLLTGGPLDAPERQRTLRNAIGWSYALLSEAQQRLLSRLSVFVGGCDLEAVEAVCAFDARPDQGLIEGIVSLVSNSLLIEQDDSRGEPRYWMLETIREYACEELDASGEADTLRRRHAEYFSTLGARSERTLHYLAPAQRDEHASAGLEVPLAGTPEERAQRELPNLRAALQWTFNNGELELALRLAVAASWGWALSSAYTEGRDWVARALNETEYLQTLERARALFWLAEFAGWQGDFRNAETFNQRARALFEQHHDQVGVFRSLLGLTQFEVGLGDLERARIALEEAGALADSLGSDHERALFLFKRAQVEGLAGNYEQAHAHLEDGLEVCRRIGAPREQWVNQLINVGWFALEQHDLASARAALDEYLAEDSGKTPSGIASAHDGLGLVALYEGDRQEAALRFRESLAIADEAGAKRTVAAAAYGLAAVEAIDGDAQRSLQLESAADVIRQSTGSPPSRQEQFIVARYLDAARAAVTDDAHRPEQRKVSPIELDEAIAYVLEVARSS